MDAIAVSFYFGEDAKQLQLTRRQFRDLSVTDLADTWKVCFYINQPSAATKVGYPFCRLICKGLGK